MKTGTMVLISMIGALGACSDNRPNDVADCRAKAMRAYNVSSVQLPHDPTAIGYVLKCMKGKGYSPVFSDACQPPFDPIAWACFE
jgi:hypothetical protein